MSLFHHKTTPNTIMIRVAALLVLFALFVYLLERSQSAHDIDPARQNQISQNKTPKIQEDANSRFDLQRVIDAANIILAIQDYYYTTDNFPVSIERLKEKKFLAPEQSIADPETGIPYYYLKRDLDFVFCVDLHSGIVTRGFNVSECPSRAPHAPHIPGGLSTTSPNEKMKKGLKLEITGDTIVNVRKGPDSKSEVTARVDSGDEFLFMTVKDNWYEIAVTEKKSGWVNGEYVKVLPNP